MSVLKRGGVSNKTVLWGLEPQFARRPHVAPPCAGSRRGEAPLAHASDVRFRREGRIASYAFGASAAAHLLLLLWAHQPVLSEGTATAFANHRPSSSAEMEVVHLREAIIQPASEPAPSSEGRRAVPVQQIDPPLVVRRQPVRRRMGPSLVRAQGRPSLAGMALPGLGDGLGGRPGNGEGDGAGEGEGEGGDVYIAPRARTILRTWSPPEHVFGTEALVRVYTDEDGLPTGAIEFASQTADRETNDEIAYRVLNLTYWPATINGEPIAAWAEVSFEFCYHGTTAASPPAASYGDDELCVRDTDGTDG